jgi:hypothetical protein
VVALVVASAALYAAALQADWRRDAAPRAALAGELDRLGVAAEDRLMSVDAAGFKYLTGLGGVVSPDDPIETVESVARAYGIRWLALERDGVVRSLAPVLAGESRPDWIGPPVFEVASADGGDPALALYPVCLRSDDQRCDA